MKEELWIGVDLDGTLAEYDGDYASDEIGPPIEAMLDRVKGWVEAGEIVKIFTARAEDESAIPAIEEWLEENGIGGLEITNRKDKLMKELWDDRVVQVIPNTGLRADEVGREKTPDDEPEEKPEDQLGTADSIENAIEALVRG